MPISQSDQLFKLIKSLTKAEKRNFKLYAKRNQSDDSLKFIKLFDIFDKQKVLDEGAILKALKLNRKNQYPNIKRHLYQQILSSIKLISQSKDVAIQVREYLDFAAILYNKGHYLQSMKILSKAESLSNKAGLQLLSLLAIEKKKIIVSRHITRSNYSDINNLVIDAKTKIAQIEKTTELSNLNVELHARYIRNGHVKSEEEKEAIVSFFEMHTPKYGAEALDFNGKVNLYKSQVWFHYILLDFKNCLKTAQKWINCFDQDPDALRKDPDLYMRGYQYLLTCAFNIKDKKSFNKYLEKLESFREENYHRFNDNSKVISFLYVHNGRINKHILEGTYEASHVQIQRTLKRLNRYHNFLDDHKTMVFWFKIAWLYLASGNPKKSIDYLLKIINYTGSSLREDIQIYARIMFLMAHYDLGNFELIPYLVSNYKRFFIKLKEYNEVQKLSLSFFSAASKTDQNKRKKLLSDFNSKMKTLKKDYFLQRAFIFLDISVWLQAKIKNRSIAEFAKKEPNYLRIK